MCNYRVEEFISRQKKMEEGGNREDIHELYLIPISPDVSDYCVYREIE